MCIFSRRKDYSRDALSYKFFIKPRYGEVYQSTEVALTYPDIESNDWASLDRLIAGFDPKLKTSVHYFRKRFLLLPSTIPDRALILNTHSDSLDSHSSDEEIRLQGLDKLFGEFGRALWQMTTHVASLPHNISYAYTNLSPSEWVRDELEMDSHQIQNFSATKAMPLRKLVGTHLNDIANLMKSGLTGLVFKDRRWNSRRFDATFVASDFLDWLEASFTDVQNRQEAIRQASFLVEKGLIQPLNQGLSNVQFNE